MTVWLLPIEPFAERYTAQWARWWPAELTAAGLRVRLVLGNLADVAERSGGEFLDPCVTWAWKGEQVASLARLWRSDEIRSGDVVVSLDLWGPATTAACYLRDTTARDVKVVAFYHAGASDPDDFLARTRCATWAPDIERGWVKGCDAVLCGSGYSRRLLNRLEPYAAQNVHVVGLPIHADELQQHSTPWLSRSPLVVFPHRLAPEKDPAAFEAIREAHTARYPNERALWVRTRDVCSTKDDYYNLLGSARCVVSTARQETFGIAMQEGIALGAWAVAPHRLAYPETLRGGGWTYSNVEEAADMVHLALVATTPAPWDRWHECAIERAASVISNLVAG